MYLQRNYFIASWKDSINRTKRFVLLIFLYTLKVLNFPVFEIFDYFREILYPPKVSKPKNHEIENLLRFSFS